MNFSFEQSKRLNDAVSAGDYSNRIIHYTSADNLEKIIQGEELWFGRIDQLNDATEFTYFADVVRKVAHQLVPNAPRSMVDQLIGNLDGAIRNSAYISSWCEYYDHEADGRLPMWIAYGDGASGVAAVVDSSQMQPSAVTPNKFSYFVFTTKVEYVRKESASETAARYLDRIRRSGVLERIPYSEAVLGSLLMARAPSIKHIAFNEEREVRFLALPGLQQMSNRYFPTNRIRTISSGEEQREYFSLELKHWVEYDLDLRLSSILRKVLVGPKNDPASRASRLRKLLNSKGLNHVPVEIVDIPFR